VEKGVEFLDEDIDVDLSEGDSFESFLPLLQLFSWLILAELLGVMIGPASPTSVSL
jgi:hypothetical protein